MQISAKNNTYKNQIKPGVDNKVFFTVEVVAPFAQISKSPCDPVVVFSYPYSTNVPA